MLTPIDPNRFFGWEGASMGGHGGDAGNRQQNTTARGARPSVGNNYQGGSLGQNAYNPQGGIGNIGLMGAGGLGNLGAMRAGNFLMNPGQSSNIPFRRALESNNRLYNQNNYNFSTMLGQMGYSPTSNFAQAMGQGIENNRSMGNIQAARDQALINEDYYRKDVAAGFGMYLSMLQQMLGLAGARANAATGAPIPGVNTQNTSSALADYLWMLGYGTNEATKNNK